LAVPYSHWHPAKTGKSAFVIEQLLPLNWSSSHVADGSKCMHLMRKYIVINISNLIFLIVLNIANTYAQDISNV